MDRKVKYSRGNNNGCCAVKPCEHVDIMPTVLLWDTVTSGLGAVISAQETVA